MEELAKRTGTYGEAAIVMDAGTGSILYAKNIDEHEYPASITKVMTALVTLKNCSLDETVTVGEECQDIESGSSVCMIEPGDQLTVEQLLYGLLLNSGNDAAMSLAVYVGGTVDNFCQYDERRGGISWSNRDTFCQSAWSS